MSTVAIVSLGRGQAMGEVRRVASWRQLFTSIGCDVVEVALTPGRRLHADGVVDVLTGRAAPERLAWSGPRLRDRLERIGPDLVVVVSTRAFGPGTLDGPWSVVLDQVDSLARSYRDRAAVVDGAARRGMYRTLGAVHRRLERRLKRSPIRRVAAGWTDAEALGAEWVPNTIDTALAPATGVERDHDVLFVGTLRYPPNIDALERMAGLWPAVQAARPDTSALVAGAAPTPRVEDLCGQHGWDLVANFESLAAVGARARVAVAPLARVAGIQNKVLEAACLGLAQVVTRQALEGFDPAFPLTGVADDRAFVAELARLLDDPVDAQKEADATRSHVLQEYSPSRWSSWAQSLFP